MLIPAALRKGSKPAGWEMCPFNLQKEGKHPPSCLMLYCHQFMHICILTCGCTVFKSSVLDKHKSGILWLSWLLGQLAHKHPQQAWRINLEIGDCEIYHFTSLSDVMTHVHTNTNHRQPLEFPMHTRERDEHLCRDHEAEGDFWGAP